MPKLRRIDQFDLYYNYIKTYNTQKEIIIDLEKELGFKILNNGNLSFCLNGKKKSLYGYKWKWSGDVLPKKEKPKKEKVVKVKVKKVETIKVKKEKPEKVVKPKKENNIKNIDWNLPPDQLYYEICRNI